MTRLLIEDEELLQLWNNNKNNSIDFKKITTQSNKKVWWKCEKGHEWQALICNVSKSKKCPYCNNRKILKGYNDLATLYPELAKEWNYKKNTKIPEDYSKTSEEKVWWICCNGHEYINRIDTRVRGVGCPYCNGRIITLGTNDILTKYPILKEYWNYDKNIDIDIRKLLVGDRNSYYWKCKNCGYEWKTRIGHLIHDFVGCRKCRKNTIPNGKLSISNTDLINEWDYNKNKEVNPKNLCVGSGQKVWWICKKGHSYCSKVYSRYSGTGCPYCSNKKVLKGYNDAEFLFPKIKKEWDYNKNKFLPSEVSSGSGKQAHFICSNGHNYIMKIRDYCYGYNCPICSNREIIKGLNDLESYDDRIMKEWNYEKNHNIDPQKISPNYTKKVWWIGECGHEWQASVYSRTKMGTNCPICSEERHASISEKSVLYYIKKYSNYKNIYENYKNKEIKLELDIFIEDIKTAIEYDGERWHKDKEKDLRKDKMCNNLGIKLIRIREYGCPNYVSHSLKIDMPNNKTNGLEIAIHKVLKVLGISNYLIDIEKDTPDILKMINFMVKENSLLTLYPELAKEWHPDKNGNLKPQHTKTASNKKVWWIGKCGHEWQASVYDRVDGDGCPYCSGHRVLQGVNDFATLQPVLLKEWDYDKNIDILPSSVTEFSSKKVWWIGKCGHEWQATIYHRSKGQGCPYCSGQKVLQGFNDFATLQPLLLKEWDYDKNIIKPYEISEHSGRKIWWKCSSCGYEWQATPDKRSNGRGCPICSHKRK